MALLTQKAIMATFGEMLEEMPFDKITVSALVKRCGISSNTFYYHYQDIYALLNTWFEQQLGSFEDDFSANGDWKSGAKQMLHTCQEHPRVIYHICDSFSREQLEQFVFASADDGFSSMIKARTAGTSLSDAQVEEIVQFCKLAFVGYFLRFLWNKMEGNIDEDVDRLGTKFESFLLGEISSAGK